MKIYIFYLIYVYTKFVHPKGDMNIGPVIEAFKIKISKNVCIHQILGRGLRRT